jgi:hypothetical protein
VRCLLSTEHRGLVCSIEVYLVAGGVGLRAHCGVMSCAPHAASVFVLCTSKARKLHTEICGIGCKGFAAVYIYVRIYVCIYIYMYIHTSMYVYICICIYKHTYIHAYIHTYVYIYVCVCIYIYTCTYISRKKCGGLRPARIYM